jgi:hypothetical protein
MHPALIATIEDFKKHVALNASTDDNTYFDQLLPDLLLAEEDYLRPALGAEFYDELLEAPASEAADRLRYLLASSLANLTMVSYVDFAQVQISGSGVQIISTEREKTAFQWQINALKASYSRKGNNGLEKALAYLESHADDFPTWATSDTAKNARGYFITSAATFSEHYNISNARLTFQALGSLLRKTERFRLEPTLGIEFFDELKQQLRDGALTAENEKLIENYLRPALAHLVMAQAIGELGFTLNGNALELNVYRPDDANSKESDPGLTALLEMKADQATDDGEKYLRQLFKHLNGTASATRYATYFNSDAYRPLVVVDYLNPISAPVWGAF